MHVEINYTPSIWHWDNRRRMFICEHEQTTPDTIEHYNYYMDAVTGEPQALFNERIDGCDQCPAYYSYYTGEWEGEE